MAAHSFHSVFRYPTLEPSLSQVRLIVLRPGNFHRMACTLQLPGPKSKRREHSVRDTLIRMERRRQSRTGADVG